MAAYLDTNLPLGSLVETWEWEITPFGRQDFHLPPFRVAEAVVRRDQLGISPEGMVYSVEPLRPDYLIDGPWSKGAQLYKDYIAQRCTWVVSIGAYDLYACEW